MNDQPKSYRDEVAADRPVVSFPDGARPAPRFEVVHKTGVERHRVVEDGRSRWVERPLSQPWHVRIIGANGEPLFSSETYVDDDSAYDVIVALATMLGVDEPLIARTTDSERRVLSGYVGDIEGDVVHGWQVPILRVEVGP